MKKEMFVQLVVSLRLDIGDDLPIYWCIHLCRVDKFSTVISSNQDPIDGMCSAIETWVVCVQKTFYELLGCSMSSTT